MSSSHLSPRRHHWWQWWRRSRTADASHPHLPAPTLGGVGLDLRPGTVTALIGEPAAAASHVLHTVAGTSSAPQDPAPAVHGEPRPRTGLVFRTPGLRPELGVRGNMVLDAATSGRWVGEERLTALVERAGLTDVDDLGAQALTPAEAVFVALVRALAPSPDRVLLDGTLDDLDAADARRALALLHEVPAQTVVLLATQRPDIAVLADRVAVVRDGRVGADLTAPSPAALTAVLRPQPPRLDRAPSADPTSYPTPDHWGTSTHTDPDAPDGTDTARGRDDVTGTATPPVTPYPSSSPAWDEDPRTQEIALLAVARVRAVKAVAARTAAAPDSLREELGAEDLRDALERLSPSTDLSGTSAEVVDRARALLGGLPGRVMPED